MGDPLGHLLRVSDVARLLGLSRSRVYELIATRELPATKIGGALRVPRAAWEAWLCEKSERAMTRVQREHRE